MNNDLLSFHVSNYNNTKFIHELKYQVHNNPKKYALETAREVESIFIQILLKSMRNSLLQENSLFDNSQSRLYADIYDQQISRELSKKGIGLTEIILKQIEQQNNTI